MKLLILGAGGHGRVVADAAICSAQPWAEIAFLDDRYPALARSGLWPVVGRFEELARFAGHYDACIAAVGDAGLRLRLLDRAAAAGFAISSVVHRGATLSEHAAVAPGSMLAAGAVVSIGAIVARGCIINTGASVDHDCRLAEGVHVCPGAHLAGGVEIGARTWFGIGAVARQGVRIGADVTVGAGAVCLEDVRDGVVVSGVPARERPS